jgi:predicted molibdopterin-dependent oxidoreductase YjgC
VRRLWNFPGLGLDDGLTVNRKRLSCVTECTVEPQPSRADWNITQKEAGKKLQDFMYRCTSNVEQEMYDYTGNNY